MAQGADVRGEIFRRLAERNWPILMMQPNELTLEQIFVRLIEGGDDLTARAPAPASAPEPTPPAEPAESPEPGKEEEE